MKFNIGDKVKFTDQEGQGIVSRIINASTLGVTVDGFELPFSVNDLIRIDKPASAAERLFYQGTATYGNPEPKDADKSKNGGRSARRPSGTYGYGPDEAAQLSHSSEPFPAKDQEKEEDARITPLKRGFVSKQPQPEGVYVGLLPLDQQFMLRGAIELYVINYTPYTLIYNLATRGGESFYGIDFASVPPYSKILVESIEREDIGLWTEGVLQCLFFQDESPTWLLPSSKDYRIRASRLSQAENYVLPVFMREKVLLVPLLNLPDHQAGHALMHPNLLSEKLEEAQQDSIRIKTESNSAGNDRPRTEGKDPMARYMIGKGVAEVDLHIEAIRESRPELGDIREEEYLNKQIMIFEDTLDKAVSRRLEKIIFIHGIGNGILKHEIEKRLRNYSNLHFMGASVLKYGRGAIEVYIDTQK